MSDKLPDWKPIHSPGIRSGDLVFYSHKVPFEIIPALSKGNKEPWTRTRFIIGE